MIKNMYEKSNCAVKIQNKVTNFFQCKRGVRQGCPLSPILFNIHINDIAYKGQTIIFYWGVTIFGTCRQFFLKSNAFQTIFFITFCNENNFLQPFLKNVTGFFIDLI